MNWKPNTIANKTLWGNSIQQFAKGHLEQLGHAVCALTIEGTAYDFQFDGLGLRDPNWGPRYWQAPKYHRWLTLNFDEGLGAMAKHHGESRRQRAFGRIPGAQRAANGNHQQGRHRNRVHRRAAASRFPQADLHDRA
jgi:hypothetical protein